MDSQPNIDSKFIAQLLKISVDQVESAVKLLDEDNTIPFIARYRRDATRGLYESQLRRIKEHVNRARALNERKAVIRKSIESQGSLSDEIAAKIDSAKTSRELEDVYLPFKPQKQSQAEIARQRGLEPLARDLLEATITGEDLPSRAEQFVRVDKGLESIADVIEGVHHLLVESFSQNVEVRRELRHQIGANGMLASKAIETNKQTEKVQNKPEANSKKKKDVKLPKASESNEPVASENKTGDQVAAVGQTESTPAGDKQHGNVPADNVPADNVPADNVPADNVTADNVPADNVPADNVPADNVPADSVPADSVPADSVPADSVPADSVPAEQVQADSNSPNSDVEKASPKATASESDSPEGNSNGSDTPTVVSPPVSTSDELETKVAETPVAATTEKSAAENPTAEKPAAKTSTTNTPPSEKTVTDGKSVDQAAPGLKTEKASPKKKKSKKKKNSSKDSVFAEFANFKESLKKIPPHRILAINRGERADKLKVTVEPKNLSIDKMIAEKMVAAEHPFQDVLFKAAKDALVDSIMPSVMREIRRDLTENAELHAGRVFAKNLRQLLTQRPVPPQRILAVDPGFRTGCKVAVIDGTGKPLETGRFFIVGKQERTDEGIELLARLVNEHKVSLIAIGNGAGCRATEKLVSDMLGNQLKETTTKYMIVNQAGAAAYSTSELAREELPDHDPIFRSAISIGRRLHEPLGELVKISPSNIGVGMYQHDVKAKHLQDSLDDEVESSVNFVGVDLNSAATALLKYVAGLNQMIARRIVEHRTEHGPFKNREQLKLVKGIGDKTYEQCAGFLRVFDGEQPLDATPIHPESYDVAEKILAKVGASSQELIAAANEYSQQLQSVEPKADTPRSSWQDVRRKVREIDLQKTADELGVGKLVVEDVIRCLMRPSRDPRHDFQAPIQRRSIISVEDLEINKEMRGQVVNIVDFGVFVDIGLGTSSLIHISQLSDKFIHDLHLAYGVGDILNVWVTEIDKTKKQVKLTAVRPAGVASSRPPRAQNRRFQGKPKGKSFRKQGSYADRRPAKPKQPPPPITQEMAEGKKPMRSFSDLAQFFGKEPKESGKKK